MVELKVNLQQRDYSKFGLIGNPFPYSGIPDENPTMYVGQENVMDTIGNILSVTISTGKSNHLIITGAYGNGKSHTLKYIKNILGNRFSEEKSPRLCVGEISHFNEGFLDIYSKFVYDLGYNFMKSKSEEFLGIVAQEMFNEGLIEKEVQATTNGWKMIINGDALLSDVVPRAIIKLNQIVKYMDFSKAFLNLAYQDNSIDAWEWICGEGVDYTKRRQIGVIKSLDEKNAIKAFLALKNTLNFLSYSAVIILIDEFENIETLQSVAKQKTLNTIRHLIDINPEGLSTIIACTPEAWQSFAEYHAFSERIKKETNLKPLNNKSVRELIIGYLRTKRNKKIASLEPFTEDSIGTIFQIGRGNTRSTLMLCNLALDLAIELGINEVNSKFLRSIIKN